MKIRIKDNSIRLRLTQSEINLLAKEGKVECQTYFSPESILFYAIETANVDTVNASFEKNNITVFLPVLTAKNWIETEQVGIEYLSQTDENKNLKVLVEKDFTCLVKRPGEDDKDAFPHPLNQK